MRVRVRFDSGLDRPSLGFRRAPRAGPGRETAENQTGPRVSSDELVRHLAFRDLVERLPRAVKRHNEFRPDLLQSRDRLADVVWLVRRKMEAPNHRMHLIDTRDRLSLPDRV